MFYKFFKDDDDNDDFICIICTNTLLQEICTYIVYTHKSCLYLNHYFESNMNSL